MSEMMPLYDKGKICLFCERPYQTKRLRSRFIRVKEVHSDFYTEYKDPQNNPLFYEVDVCPHCGFASTETFTTYFPPGTDTDIAKTLKNWNSQDFGRERCLDDAIRSFKLGILSAKLKKEKHVVIGGLCLRLAWLYRSNEDGEQEVRFLNQALKHYKESYQLGDYLGTHMSDMRMIYLLGELSRRIGDNAEAIRCFSLVIQHKNKEYETKLVEMAREQWYIIRNSNVDDVLTV